MALAVGVVHLRHHRGPGPVLVVGPEHGDGVEDVTQGARPRQHQDPVGRDAVVSEQGPDVDVVLSPDAGEEPQRAGRLGQAVEIDQPVPAR